MREEKTARFVMKSEIRPISWRGGTMEVASGPLNARILVADDVAPRLNPV